MDKVCIITLGCKVNKYESDSIARMLEDNGFDTTDNLEYADYYILNTCAVTNEAEKKSRQYISKITKLNPKAKIIVSGCAVESNKNIFLNKNNVIGAIDYQRKDLILQLLLAKEFDITPLEKFNYNLINPKVNQTRAYIKIQDGCNRFCSYCAIPYFRGRSVSRDLDSIVKEANQLDNVYKEIVLVGIDMSDYRIDGQLALDKLMAALSHLSARIRLGSLEVSAISDSLLKQLKDMPNFAPHFHLSLQSGDNEVLKKMNRKYTREEYIAACNLIYKYFPDANITTDIIVGFPFETDDAFQNTIELVKEVNFGKVHCFPFSAKKGTVAAKYKDIDANIKKERMSKLETVAASEQLKYNSKFLNKKLSVLVEEEEDGYLVGFSDNYIKCYMNNNTNKYPIGEIVEVTAIKLKEEGLEVK